MFSGTVSFTTITPVEVGNPTDPIYATLDIATIRGLTITPWASGIVFSLLTYPLAKLC
jgi:hypothetical protein